MNETWMEIARTIRMGAYVGLTAGGAFVLYHAGRAVYDDWYARMHQARQDRLTVEDLKRQSRLANLREIKPDAQGRYPLLFGEGGILRDPNNLRAFTLQTVLERWPYLDQIEYQLEALRQVVQMKLPAHYENIIGDQLGPGEQEQAEQEQAAVTLGKHTLSELLTAYSFKPSLHNVLIGEYIDQAENKVKPLTLSIPHSVHVLCTGASGLGKSTLLEGIALQLAGLPNVRLAAVDYGSGTFDLLEGALHWKLADSPNLAIALFRELIALFQERRELYKRADRVRSLDQYNAVTGDNLPFVVCFVDETSALLEHAGTKEPLVEIARVGRKYGLGLVLGGTDFAADTLPSKARGNCQARIAFWLEAGLSRSLLKSEAATTQLTDVGEVMVRKPGTVGLFQGRTPLVTEASYALLPHRAKGPVELQAARDPEPEPEPEPELVHGATVDQVQEIVERHAAGESDTAIAGALWHPTTYYINRVRSILAEHDNNNKETGHESSTGGDGDREQEPVVVVDWCEFCDNDADAFSECTRCGVAVCDSCARGGLCPDCQELAE